MIQEIITYLILFLVIAKIFYGIYNAIFSKKKKSSCSCGNSTCSSQDFQSVKRQSKIYIENLKRL